MINYIFALFLTIGITYGFITGNIDKINESIITSGDITISLITKLIPLICLWLGIMKIAEDSGLINKLSLKLSKIIHPLFPGLPKNSPAISYIGTSMIMNILGLGSAATPFGLKAIKSMQEYNPKKDTATNDMITFLVINTASITLIPTTVISIRSFNNAKNPTDIIPVCILTTIISCLLGLIFNFILAKLWRKDE